MSDYYRPADAVLQERLAASPLFGRPQARPTDPATSHEAAAKAKTFAGDHRTRILAALEAGPAGQTELARRTGLTVAAVSRRLGELARAGLIVREGEARSASGGREAAYRSKPASL
jgi:predicted transcriptional regulator